MFSSIFVNIKTLGNKYIYKYYILCDIDVPFLRYWSIVKHIRDENKRNEGMFIMTLHASIHISSKILYELLLLIL